MQEILIPVHPQTKAPLIKKWQKLVSSPDLCKYPNCKTGLLLGTNSGYIVVDVDIPKPKKQERDGMKKIEQLLKGIDLKTKVVRSPSGGVHYYFKYHQDLNTKNIGINGYSIDLLTNDNYVICPPTTGYEVIQDDPICDIPNVLFDWIMIWRNRHQKKNTSGKKTKKTQGEQKDNFVYDYNPDALVDVLNLLPSKYYDDTKHWLTVTSILKSQNFKTIWDDFSKKSDRYDKESNFKIWDGLVPKLNIDYLNSLIKDEKIKSQFKVNKTIDINTFTTTPTKTVNSKYIDLDDFDIRKHRSLFIKSATGTGKTTATAKLIKRINYNNGYRVLSIVSRRSLANQHETNFDLIKNYQNIDDVDELQKERNLVIQIDSIIKLDADKIYNSIIYLDEVNSLIEYMLHSSTLKNKRLQVYNTLCELIYNASYVIGIDADLSDNVIRFFKGLNLNPYILLNKYQNAKGETVKHYKCKNRLISIMKSKLKKNEHFICCFDSLREQDIIVKELKSYCERNDLDRKDDMLIYSSVNGDDNDLKNVQTIWKNKYIFYTPKIVYGLDFVPDHPIDVFAIFQCTSINPLGFAQMIARCRKVKKMRYYIQERNIKLQYMTVEDIKKDYNDILSYYENVINELDDDDLYIEKESVKTKKETLKNMKMIQFNPRTGEYDFSNDLFDDLFYLSELHNNIMRSAMNYHFKKILEQKGYVVLTNNDVSKHKINEKQLKVDVKEEKEQIIERAINDEDISLTASEKKIKQQMKKRADILNIDITNEKYRDIISDDRLFVQHLTLSKLLDTESDEKLVDKVYKDLAIKNVKSIETKIKLIKEVGSKLGKTLDLDFNNDVNRFDEKLQIDTTVISKVFRYKDLVITTYSDAYQLYINMLKHCLGGLMTYQKQSRMNGKKTMRVYEIIINDMTYHLDLLKLRNKQLSNIDKQVLSYYNYIVKPPKHDAKANVFKVNGCVKRLKSQGKDKI